MCARLAAVVLTWLSLVTASVLGFSLHHRAFAGDTLHGRVETDLSMPSPMLGHNIKYALYTPAVAARAAGPLPVLYLLHGRDDDERAWLDKGQIATVLDRMIAAGTLRPVAVVMPMAANSWYVDDARGPRGFGPFASALAEEFMPSIELRHRLASCRSQRAIGGLSMGGYGALMHAFTRPDMFNSAVSLSGSIFSEKDADIEARSAFNNRVLAGIYGEPFDAQRFKSWTAFVRLNTAPPTINALGVWLAAGDRDFSSILSGTVRLHQELRQRKVESHLRIYDGDHTWPLWTRAIEPALTWLSSRLAQPCTSDSQP
jgi:S-formylglutathione hydrolase FrmB